jgi:hypothetical protein
VPDDFGKWWNDLSKHQKRVQYWLPHAKHISNHARAANRSFRYFTFCARTMIDVFMMAKEDILSHDGDYGNISDVVFCESNSNHFPEITEMLGVEGSGFFGRLEEMVLFQDDDYTAQFPEIRHIEEEIEREGESIEPAMRLRLDLKIQHLEFAKKFPRDYINLDFCELYYLKPEDEPPVEVFQVSNTVERILRLQAQVGVDDDGQRVTVNEFVMCITCRYDDTLPNQAFVRLENIVRKNSEDNDEYRNAVEHLKGTAVPREWRETDAFDFFLASWPKDLLRTAHSTGWEMEVLDYVYYDRPDDGRGPYRIVCLVARFERNVDPPTYIDQAISVLTPESRVAIPEISRKSDLGKNLLSDLSSVVNVRNQRADRIGREPLPEP